MDKLQKKQLAGLHWAHWIIILASLLLTFFAWYFSSQQLEEKVEARFLRESERVVELVKDRMRKYEDALWGGVAYFHAAEFDVNYEDWKRYAKSLNIGEKYPGINGIGVIHKITPDSLESYLTEERRFRENYTIHPSHSESVYYPITFIEPYVGNEKAVGLDMAHETNRFTAAKKARDSGRAQITGPIVLVQDSGKTPGFLFYAPMFKSQDLLTEEQRRTDFYGIVYAPFVVNRLMQGTLRLENRQVLLRISDSGEEIFSEFSGDREEFDARPLFKQRQSVELYGRIWEFDIWSSSDFREAAENPQPMLILAGGIVIDVLLISLFFFISRGRKRALEYAESMTDDLKTAKSEVDLQKLELEEKYEALQSKNEELKKLSEMTVGREKQMILLKREINELHQELKREAPYDLSFADKGKK